ncbi:MAG: MarR family winged helix-turn-helix transcriptional regulator [Shimia sp.]
MPDRTPPHFELFNEIGILEQLSRAMFQARLPQGVLVSHFAVLNHLIRVEDGRTPLALARAFQVPKTTMTHTLAGLEARGWVRLAPNPDDGRSKLAWLTPEGRAFRDRAIADLDEDMAWLAAEVPAGEVAAALPFLRRLRQIMDARRAL